MLPPLASSPSDWEDSLLAWRLRAGSASALARSYEKHRHRLLQVATGLLADPALAEDVVQDVFLQIARAPATLRPNGSLRAFLCTCVANRARNTDRARRRRASNPEVDPDSTPGHDPGPARWLLHHDRLAALAEALAQLPVEQREAVVLHLQGGLPFRDIAAATGVSINTAQSRYRYGLERLRTELKGNF